MRLILYFLSLASILGEAFARDATQQDAQYQYPPAHHGPPPNERGRPYEPPTRAPPQLAAKEAQEAIQKARAAKNNGNSQNHVHPNFKNPIRPLHNQQSKNEPSVDDTTKKIGVSDNLRGKPTQYIISEQCLVSRAETSAGDSRTLQTPRRCRSFCPRRRTSISWRTRSYFVGPDRRKSPSDACPGSHP